VKEQRAPRYPPHPGDRDATRLLALVGRSGPPPRPIGGLLLSWYAASRTPLLFDEWADPATSALAAAFSRDADLDTVEDAVVAFAQARAGADHGAEAVSADLVALVRLAWPSGRGTWGEDVDPVGLLARALAAWAAEHAAASGCSDCIDAATGLATASYLRERVRELHGQCRACQISPAVSFGAVVVRLDLGAVSVTVRMGVRVTVGRLLAQRFHGGETVATVSPSRMVVVMSTYGIERAIYDVTSDLAELAALDGVGLSVSRLAFADDSATTFRSLAGTSVGA
jgi:hypothetical protein